MSTSPEASSSGGITPVTTGGAANLRVTLDRLLGEHAILAAKATFLGLDGDAMKPEYTAAVAQLDTNTTALGSAMQSVYGADAEKTFLTLWRSHIGFFVDYTVGTATRTRQRNRRPRPTSPAYSCDVAAFIGAADPNLPAAAVEDLLKQHIHQLVDAIDAYAAKDYAKAYWQTVTAYDHIFMTGDALAGGIVKQFPDKFAT